VEDYYSRTTKTRLRQPVATSILKNYYFWKSKITTHRTLKSTGLYYKPNKKIKGDRPKKNKFKKKNTTLLETTNALKKHTFTLTLRNSYETYQRRSIER